MTRSTTREAMLTPDSADLLAHAVGYCQRAGEIYAPYDVSASPVSRLVGCYRNSFVSGPEFAPTWRELVAQGLAELVREADENCPSPIFRVTLLGFAALEGFLDGQASNDVELLAENKRLRGELISKNRCLVDELVRDLRSAGGRLDRDDLRDSVLHVASLLERGGLVMVRPDHHG